MLARPTVANVDMPLSGTEYSYTLPNGTRAFWLKLRDPGYALQACYVTGQSDTTYLTVAQGKIHKEEHIKQGGTTVFFRSTQADMVAEVISFK